MKLIESKTLGTAQASIEFTSIPSTFTDLVALVSLRSTTAVDYIALTLNGSSSGFTSRDLSGNGSAAGSSSRTDNLITGITVESGWTANTFGNAQIYFPNYTAAVNKSFSVDTVIENNATLARQEIRAALWSNTATISSMSFIAQAGANFAIGSTISLYGILKGSDGIVTTSP